jgi:hypothetical protein
MREARLEVLFVAVKQAAVAIAAHCSGSAKSERQIAKSEASDLMQSRQAVRRSVQASAIGRLAALKRPLPSMIRSARILVGSCNVAAGLLVAGLNSLFLVLNSLFLKIFSLLMRAGKRSRSGCSTAVSCYEIGPGSPKIAKFPVKFPVSREFAWRRVRSPLCRQPTFSQ